LQYATIYAMSPFHPVTSRVSDSGLEAWRTFLQAHAAVVSRIESELERHGDVALTWYDVLVAIRSAPRRRLRMSALADALVLTRSNATRLVDKLERAKLVRRETAGEDRRGAEAVLTPAGLEALRRAWPVYARGIQELFLSRLSDSEVDVIVSGLGRVRDGAGGRVTGR
jgi:DNA-binding MarR family transcriptional regulator